MTAIPTLDEVADLCQEAADQILIHGHRRGATTVGMEDLGLCLGSALAMADQRAQGTAYDYRAFTNPAGSYFLCPAGQVFREYADRVISSRTLNQVEGRLHAWNDLIATEDDVFDLLMNVQKQLREDAATAPAA